MTFGTNILILLKISGEVNILYGDAGEEIVKRASEVDACLVVTGTRGLGVIRRTVLGSVSQYVLHHSNVPVAIYTDKCFKGKKWSHLKCRSVYLMCIFCLHTSMSVGDIFLKVSVFDNLDSFERNLKTQICYLSSLSFKTS